MRFRTTIAATAAALAAAAPVRAALPPGNLLQNPGAEAGKSGAGQVVPIPGWTVTGSFTVDHYGDTDRLSKQVSAAIGGGAKYFFGGPSSAQSSASQTVDVSAAAAEIDAGTLPVGIGGYLGGYASQSDSMALRADFLDAGGAVLGSLAVRGPTSAERSGQTTLVAEQASATLPKGTRSIRVTLTATRTDGSNNDGYADNVFLVVGSGAGIGSSAPLPPPKPGVAVNVTSGGGTTLVRLAGATRFVPLKGGAQIRVGATVDATRGSVALASADGRATFSRGAFTVREAVAPAATRVTVVTLAGGDFTACPKRSKRKTAGVAAAPKVVRQLFGNGKGRFRTTGRFASATVRGTVWLVQDRCDGTLVRVLRGTVVVSDLRRHRLVTVTAGRSYLAG